MHFDDPRDVLHHHVTGAIERGEKEPIVGIPDEKAAIAASFTIGERHGKNAASWVFDGNTSIEEYQTVLTGIDKNDPEIYDMFRVPNLSGEYADDYSERDLANELGIEYISEMGQQITDAYSDGAWRGFWDEIERIARLQLG